MTIELGARNPIIASHYFHMGLIRIQFTGTQVYVVFHSPQVHLSHIIKRMRGDADVSATWSLHPLISGGEQ